MSLDFNTSITLPIVVFLASVLIVYISYKAYRRAKGVQLIIVHRLLILFFLVVLLVDPVYKTKGVSKNSLPWHVYIDNSLSIKYHKQPSSIAYKNGIVNFLKKLNDSDITFETYFFGSELDSVNSIDGLQLNANSTNFGLILDNINSNYKNNVAGAIIFTDGQINQGPPFQEFSKINDEFPLHIVGIGDTTPMLDISIQSVNAPPLCVKGENINLDVTISSLGNINERINVTLFDENGKLIGSKIISVFGDELIELVRFQIKTDKIGENNFLVKCSALSDEINILNNQQTIALHVMKDQYNIALVTGAPSYNTRAIKNFLNTQGNNKVDHFIITSENFNQNVKKFLEKKYELIIFDNNPVSSSAKKWESITRLFTKKIISHNTSFFIIPGPEIDISSLNKYLNIIDLEAKSLNRESKENIKWEFLKSWYDLASIRDNNISSSLYASNPPQSPAFSLIDKFKIKNDLIYAKYYNNESEFPLLVLGEKQSIRYAIWNSNNLAALKHMLNNTDSDFLFENSIKRIMNWLLKKSDNKEFIFRTDKNSYQHGESVVLSGISSDMNHDSKINEGIVELYSKGKYISSKPLFYDLNENIYRSKFWAPKSGEINYIVKMNRGMESYEVSNGTFKVQESHIELNRIFLDEKRLINLSNNSNGVFKNWDEKEDLLKIIEDVKINESYVSVITFRYNYFYIGIIIILFYSEWFFRRKIGLN